MIRFVGAFFRVFPGLWVNVIVLSTLAALLGLAFTITRLSGLFVAEWTLWIALVVMVAGFIIASNRLRRR